MVGQLGTLCGSPIGALLQVIDAVSGAVAAALVLAVGILDGPRLAAQAVALSVEQVPLGNGGVSIISLLVVDNLDAYVLTFDACGELLLLPTVASFEAGAQYGLLALEAEHGAGLAV